MISIDFTEKQLTLNLEPTFKFPNESSKIRRGIHMTDLVKGYTILTTRQLYFVVITTLTILD